MMRDVPHVSKIFIYPIKSLDRVAVNQAEILKSGALKGDREFAIFDDAGKFVNGKRNRRIHRLRSQVDLNTGAVSLQAAARTADFSLQTGANDLEAWLGNYFDLPVRLQQNRETGFPDDLAAPGPTLISTATLEAIAAWYPGLSVDEVRRRFRTNIEISGVPAFWEDRLFATAEQVVAFRIGPVQFQGVNPCQRCIVVSRDSQTGDPDPNFQKTFLTHRQETLPAWAEKSRFNHFYRLAVNTRVPASEAGKRVAIGDTVEIA